MPDDSKFDLTILMCVRNAAAHLDAALEALLASVTEISTRTLLIVNGSSDETAAKGFSWVERFAARDWELMIVESGAQGKPASLRLGESRAGPGPVMVLDSRVRLAPDALELLWMKFTTCEYDLVSGDLTYVESPSRIVSAFSRAYSRSPYSRSSDVKGTCVIFTERHRHVIRNMPDIGSDDRYYLSQTARNRRTKVPGARVFYYFPERPRDLLAQQVRWQQTNRALDRTVADYDRNEHELARWPYFGRSARPDLVAMLTYGGITALSALIARIRPSTKPVW